MNMSSIANHVTLQNLINCYVKETGEGEWKGIDHLPFPLKEKDVSQVLVISFRQQGITLYIPARYQSPTGRHLFSSEMFYQVDGRVKTLDYVTFLSFMQKELSETSEHPVDGDELLVRTVLSNQALKRIFTHRTNSMTECYQVEKTFLQSEQSLLIGHQLHPTPKNRQGIDEDEELLFTPERKGSFQLHYFRAACELVDEKSALADSASELIKHDLLHDPNVQDSFKASYCQADDYVLLPVHPLQARKLLGKKEIADLIQAGKLSYLGPQGRAFYPTSSLRTVYHPEAEYMYKFSIPVKITNSLRVNKRKELARGVEVSELLKNGLYDQLKAEHPAFNIVQDPAYITLSLDSEESGLETVIRENPFRQGGEERTTLLAALCQDSIQGNSHLTNLMVELAKQKKISVTEASKWWFSRYLNVSLRPLYWLYATHGIALEAHQQNSIIKLDAEGLPSLFYYRDNQGYYFMQSKAETLKQFVPTLNEQSDTICSDAVAEERFRYYVFFNHLFGLVNAFGTNRLIDEEQLLHILREELTLLRQQFGDPTNLVNSLLHEEMLPCKANLLTRIHDMDELEGSLATQSVYVPVPNPLVVKAGELHEM
ncbi:IucA/IucC family siderophore biosynthesis protein [Halalkalibacterium halodurans]|uniref:IucA/IucC family protein n=1 Tax=Halalkalibacterium halodurans TaxID=86665 RepID=UPI002E22C4AA|nr:IucA/IucC family siderophore biosynthesis protein [Halalkalibacterium halodurans]